MEKTVCCCPNCGFPMRKIATTTLPNGKKLVSYICPNQAKCGTVIKREE